VVYAAVCRVVDGSRPVTACPAAWMFCAAFTSALAALVRLRRWEPFRCRASPLQAAQPLGLAGGKQGGHVEVVPGAGGGRVRDPEVHPSEVCGTIRVWVTCFCARIYGQRGAKNRAARAAQAAASEDE
jgi:hypothetical protein